MATFKYCPECLINSRNSKLVLRQINFRQAVYLCENKACTYPDGYKLVDIEQRTLSQLAHEKKQLSIEKTDLDTWLEFFFADDDNVQNKQNSDDGSINDDDLSKIIDEINKPLDENDIDLQYDSDLYTWIDAAFEKCNLDNGTLEYQAINEVKDIDKVINNAVCDNLLFNVNMPCNLLKGNKLPISTMSSNCNNTNNIIDINDTSVNNKILQKISNDKSIVPIQPAQYRILNFEQINTPTKTKANMSYRKEQNQASTVNSQYRIKSLLPPKKRKIMPKNSSKFKDCRFVNILIKPPCIK